MSTPTHSEAEIPEPYETITTKKYELHVPAQHRHTPGVLREKDAAGLEKKLILAGVEGIGKVISVGTITGRSGVEKYEVKADKLVVRVYDHKSEWAPNIGIRWEVEYSLERENLLDIVNKWVCSTYRERLYKHSNPSPEVREN